MFKLCKLVSKFQLTPYFIPSSIDKDTFEFTTEGLTNGYYEYYDIHLNENRIVIWGKNDERIFDKMSNDEKTRLFEKIKKCPLIVVSNEFEIEKIKPYCEKYGLIILQSRFEKYQIHSMLNSYITHKVAKRTRIHGSLVNVFGEGVLIIGKSGIGKSELVVELINEKHLFVADDAVDVFRFGDRLIGQSADITKELIEIRGVGLINVRKTYGIKSISKRSQINLVIELVELNDVKSSIERLGREMGTYDLMDEKLPKIQIPISPGRRILTMVEAAVTIYKHKKYENYIAADELDFTKK